jgi:uncharacterized protein (TIGR03435 family)
MKIFNQLLGRFGRPPLKNVEAAGERVFHEVFVRRERARLTPDMDTDSVRLRNSRLPVFALSFAVLALVLMVAPIRKLIWHPKDIREGGESIGAGETVRVNDDASKVFTLADGSRVEMRSGSELVIQRADDGIRLHLNKGTVIVNAAKQRNGHLYVQTKDITVSVVGTVFFVRTEETGSSVGVLEGVVVVSQAEIPRRLRAGEEFSTPPPSTSMVLLEEVSWSRYAGEHRSLLKQSAGPEAVKQEPEKSAVLSQTRQGAAPSRTGFSAVSIRRNKSSEPGTFGDGGPGRYRATNIPIGDLLRDTYDIKDFELIGAPDWLDTERYDIEATLENPVKRGDMGPLIQALLEDRFKLEVHGEARETAVYFLVPAKGGTKLKVGRTCTPPERGASIVRGRDYSNNCGFMVGNDSALRATSITVTALTDRLSGIVKRRVLDKTGFTAPFDVNLNWRPEGVEVGDPAFANLPSIFVALEEELGLKLESGRAPIDVLVIDHIERPSEN